MKTSNWLLMLVAIAGTVAIFFLLGPATKTTLFYVNMSLTLVLEIAAMSALFWNRKDVQKIATTAQVFYYAILCGAWMLAFNLFLADKISLHWYYAVFILLTINYAAVLTFLYQAGKHQRHVNAACKCETQLKNSNNIKYHRLYHKYQEAAGNSLPDCSGSLELAIEKIAIIPQATREQNPEFMEYVDTRFGQIEQEIDTLTDTQEAEKRQIILTNIQAKTDSLINYITETKNRLS